MKEVRELNFLASEFQRRGDVKRAEEYRKKANNLSNSNVNPDGLSTDELMTKYTKSLVEETRRATTVSQDSPEYRAAVHHYLRTGDYLEKRDVLVGTQTISFSQLVQGGVLFPVETEQEYTVGQAAFDPLLNPAIVNFKMSDTPMKLRTQVLREIDLSTVVAQQINETSQQLPQNFTYAGAKSLRGNITYRFSLAASIEADEDLTDWLLTYARTAAVAFARQLGKDAALGNGGLNTPAGLFPFLGPSVYQTGSGKITLTDINTIWSKVDPAYRAGAKTAWLCSDAVFTRLLNAVDSSNRPLIDVVDGTQRLRGKPIYVSPSLSNALTSEGFGALIFGNLDYFKVRVSKPWFRREINGGRGSNPATSAYAIGQAGVGDITKGECLYVTRQKMDCAFLDPTGGNTPPIIWAVVTT